MDYNYFTAGMKMALLGQFCLLPQNENCYVIPMHAVVRLMFSFAGTRQMNGTIAVM